MTDPTLLSIVAILIVGLIWFQYTLPRHTVKTKGYKFPKSFREHRIEELDKEIIDIKSKIKAKENTMANTKKDRARYIS